jgi:signal peptidase I
VLSPQPQHEPLTTEPTSAAELLGRDVPATLGIELTEAPAELAPEPGSLAPEPAAEPPPTKRSPWLVLSLQVGALLAFAYLCLFNLSVVRGSSMAPRIHDGDRILIDHLSYVFGDVQRGDIVVLKYPLDPSVDYIKRVVGLPGDEVLLQDGQVWVNGERIDEPYVDEPDPFSRQRVRVKPAHFFVLGDNRPRSSDSREFGLVPQDYIRGRVELRVWPPERAGPIDSD